MTSDLLVAAILVGLLLVGFRRFLAIPLLKVFEPVVQRARPSLRIHLARVLELLGGPALRAYGLVIRTAAFRDLGLTDQAVHSGNQLLAVLSRVTCPWWFVNIVVDTLVSAGRYADALQIPDLWSSRAQDRGRKTDLSAFCFARINQAEALYNQGHSDPALESLDAVEGMLTELNPGGRDTRLARNGLRCLRAWILIHLGRLDEARAQLSAVEPAALASYAAELDYTWAALARESGDLPTALARAESGLASAQRASSRRNGMLLIAAILMLKGDTTRARAICDDAIADPYRGQGGDGLLRFAELLEHHGDFTRSAELYILVTERDPESTFASLARTRLSRHGGLTQV